MTSRPEGITGSQFQMFADLANPRQVDFEQDAANDPFIHGAPPPAPGGGYAHHSPPQKVQEVRPPAFFSHMEDTRSRGSSRGRSEPDARDELRDDRSRSSFRAPSRAPSRGSSRRSSRRSSQKSSRERHRRSSVRSEASSDASVSSRFRQNIQAEKDAEKMQYLMELRRMAGKKNIRLTKDWSMRDRHEDIELEYNRQKIACDTNDSVNFMSSGLRMAISGIELANHRFGPWLELDGFADEACVDMNKYRPALTRIYKRVWRRGGTVNPWLELLFTLGGAVFMFHLRSKIMGGGSSRPATSGAPAPAAPAPSSTPFNLGPFATPAQPPANHNMPTAPPPGGRKRMRRPMSPGGSTVSGAPPGGNPLSGLMGGGGDGNPLAGLMGGGGDGNPLAGLMGGGLMQGLMGGPPPPSVTGHTVQGPPPTAGFKTVVFDTKRPRRRGAPQEPPHLVRDPPAFMRPQYAADDLETGITGEIKDDSDASSHTVIDIDIDGSEIAEIN